MALNPKYIDSTGLVENLPLVSDGIKGVIYGDPYISTSGGTIVGDLEVTGTLTTNSYEVLTVGGGTIVGDLEITGNLTINGVAITPYESPYSYDTEYKCLVFTS